MLGVAPVVPLLAWVYGLGSFAHWFLAVAAPATAVIVVLAVAAPRLRRTGTTVAAGVLGGALGTLGYDVFRVPFTAAGMRVLAPIDSYGVLLLDARTSSALTGFAGWSFHLVNGIGFGIAYAAAARGGRRWPWAVAWAMVLETATIVTPFAGAYALRGQPAAIAVAYAAHLAYGIPLGLVVQGAGRWRDANDAPIPAAAIVAVAAVVLIAWHRPWSTTDAARAAARLRPQPAAVVERGRFVPEWLRVAPGQCITIANRGDTTRFCPPPQQRGVVRVKLGNRPFSGGFVIVDAALRVRDHAASRPEVML